MGISYNKLWKLLIDKGMKKGDLQRAARVSSSSMAKLAKGEVVTTEVLTKICVALSVEPGDIMGLELSKNAQGESL
jgi:DNA-binding Xre family transcriptional regulator